MASLWGEEFTIPNKESTKTLLNKVSKPKKVQVLSIEKQLKSSISSIEDKLKIIYSEVDRILGHYRTNTVCIRSKEQFQNYIDKCIENGIVAIDTETNNSLDPLTCKLMGLCLYTPNMEAAYVPINHTDLENNLLNNQLTTDDCRKQIQRLNDNNTKQIFHNGKFDYKVIKCTCDVSVSIYWDTMVGAKILDENERAGLKQQYIQKIDSSQEKYSIENLFENIPYNFVDPDIFALYSATDSFMTYKLYEWQKNQFSKPENNRLYTLFREVETPLTEIIANMELTGVCIDLEYSKRLSYKFHQTLQKLNIQLDQELDKLGDKINSWRLTSAANDKSSGKSKNDQLTNPININSPTQLAILIYDVLGFPPYSSSSPRSTSEDALLVIQDKLPIVKLILEIRGMEKLLGTYVDKLPTILSTRDGRLHGEFLQFGADTGRFSSKNPNLQNIPARGDNSVRRMFVASPGYTFVGSDYSQQEPRLLSHYSGDENMINAYRDGRDLYAMIASKVYHNNYEDNKEFFPDGSMNIEGKHRRSSCKSLLLGIMYGMGDSMTASRIGCSLAEAKKIKRDFFDSFPKVEKWINETHESVHQLGYVEDVWGRRRRLPDIFLKKYEITKNNISINFNPLLNSSGNNNDNLTEISEWENQLCNCKNKQEAQQLILQIKSRGYSVKENGGYIATAERQSVNARVQGGSATMSKRAIVSLGRNPELKKLGFRPLILVHDEIIGECPIENKERVKELLSQSMISAALPEVVTPMKCDADDFIHWYDDVYGADIRNTYDRLLKQNKSPDEAFEEICKEHIECLPDEIKQFINNDL